RSASSTKSRETKRPAFRPSSMPSLPRSRTISNTPANHRNPKGLASTSRKRKDMTMLTIQHLCPKCDKTTPHQSTAAIPDNKLKRDYQVMKCSECGYQRKVYFDKDGSTFSELPLDHDREAILRD